MKLNLTKCSLDDKQKEEFLTKLDDIQKEMDRLEHLGIIRKGLTSYSSPVVLVKRKNQNLYRVCSDFQISNKKLLKINHAFPVVRECIEQLGRK